VTEILERLRAFVEREFLPERSAIALS